MKSSDRDPDVRIGPCPSQDRRAALSFLFSKMPPAQQDTMVASLLSGAEGNLDLDGLRIATADERLRGAIWAQVQSGRTAVLWPPVVEGDDANLARLLLEESIVYLAPHQVTMAQALLKSTKEAEVTPLVQAGFAYLTDLLYLRAATKDVAPPGSAVGLSLEPYQESERSRLAKAIQATYEETQDCPTLNGLRDLNDVIEGYQAAGEYHPSRWFLARANQRDIGVLLLTDHPASTSWELVYMGIVPNWRGRGCGELLVRHALWMTQAACRDRLVLGVDAQNLPAIEVYERCGFAAWDRRSIYLKCFIS